MIRAIDKWLPGYLGSVLRRPSRVEGLKHLVFCVADHFEPFLGGVSDAEALGRVRRWVDEYPRIVGEFRDADGRPPRHTFFIPADEYDDGWVGALADFCRSGFGEIEIQLHHRYDTAEDLTWKLEEFRDYLHDKHGMLGCDADGRTRYGFVHGNWALCNSRPDGDWCGVNEELAVLAATGCYADFTFPSAPSPTQPRMVNSIYYAWDQPGKPRGHDRGVRAQRGKGEAGSGKRQGEAVSGGRQAAGGRGEGASDPTSAPSESGRHRTTSKGDQIPDSALLLIQGPLALDWRRRKWGVIPRVENAEISRVNAPVPGRIDLWVRQHIHVVGRPDWVFVKVHTHGCAPGNADILLGEPMRQAHEYLKRRYDDGQEWQLHYVSAREMRNMISAAERGNGGNPGAYRDCDVGPMGKPSDPNAANKPVQMCRKGC